MIYDVIIGQCNKTKRSKTNKRGGELHDFEINRSYRGELKQRSMKSTEFYNFKGELQKKKYIQSKQS